MNYIQIKNFKTEQQIIQLFIYFNKKVTENIKDKKKKEALKNYFKLLIPTKTIECKSIKNFIIIYKTSKKEIIKDSIVFGFPNIDEDYIEPLTKYFKTIIKHKKPRILEKENKPIFIEITIIMKYAKDIDTLLKEYPLETSVEEGTKKRSTNQDKLIKKQLNNLKDRLENPYFKLETGFEINKTKHQISILEKSLEKKFKDLPEILNTMNTIFGFEFDDERLPEYEKASFKQVLTFFNGIRTSDYQILYSFTIYTCHIANIHNKKYFQKLANSIYDISTTLFKETVDSIELRNDSRIFTYKDNKIHKEFILKTHLDDIPVFIYKENKNQTDPFKKVFDIGMKALQGIKHDYDDSLPNKNELTEKEIQENFFNSLSLLDTSKEELKELQSIEQFLKNPLRPSPPYQNTKD